MMDKTTEDAGDFMSPSDAVYEPSIAFMSASG